MQKPVSLSLQSWAYSMHLVIFWPWGFADPWERLASSTGSGGRRRARRELPVSEIAPQTKPTPSQSSPGFPVYPGVGTRVQ